MPPPGWIVALTVTVNCKVATYWVTVRRRFEAIYKLCMADKVLLGIATALFVMVRS